MQQAAGESLAQWPFPVAPPRDLVDEAYALIPHRGNCNSASQLDQQEATTTYLSVWLGDGQPVTFYAPPNACCPRGFYINCTLGKCTDLPWIVDRFFIHGLDRNYQSNRQIRRALDTINSWTQFLDNHSELKDHPGDPRALPQASAPQ
jgi:hypothetical protein